MKKRLMLTMLLITTLVAMLGCGEKEVITKDEIRPIKSLKIGEMEPFGGRWYPGKATATQEANLSFRVPGTVQRLPVDLGVQVNKGDLLARLDPQDYQVALNSAQARLREAEAGLELATSEYERVARVYDKDPGAVSKSLVDVRKAQLDSAKAQIVAAQAAVESATDNLSYTYLKSPYAGVVVEKFVEQFEDVQAKQSVIRILDTSSIEFTVNIPETLMEHVDKVKQTGAYVVFDAYPDVEVPAKVKEVGKEPSKTTRTYPVTLIMEQPEKFKILAGMAGKAKGDKKATAVIAAEEGLVGIEIPITATFSDEARQSFVWVVDENSKQVSKRAIKVINLTENGAMVTGLQPGEMIATAGASMLVDGQQVRILE